MTLIEGAIQADARGTSLGRGPCLAAYIDDAKVLSGNVYIRVWWQALKTFQVENFVEIVCDNPWISIPGCGEVKKIVETVNKWTSFDLREDLFSHPGFSFPNDWVWLDHRACEEALPATRLELCNDSDETIFAIVGAPDSAGGELDSRGQEALLPRECNIVDLGYQPDPHVRLYAEDEQGNSWRGDAGHLCVSEPDPSSPLAMGDADTEACGGENERRVETFLYPITPHETTRYTFR